MVGQTNVKTEWAQVSDEALIEALRYPGDLRGRGGKPMEPWLYAVADPWDSKKADLSRWFVIGPVERRGYIKGPFSRQQVERLAATAQLSPVCFEGDVPITYRLHPMSHRVQALEAQLRHLTLPSQAGYRRKIQKELLRHVTEGE